MSAYERYLQSQGGSSGSSGSSLSPYQRFQKGITIQLPKPKLIATSGGGSIDVNKQEEQKNADFLKMPWWKQIFQPQVWNKDTLVQAVKEAPKTIAKKSVDFIKDTAKGTGTYQYTQDLYGATAGIKRYNKAVDQYVQLEDTILKKIRTEKDPKKKAHLFDILKSYQADAPKKEDFAPVLGKSNAQILGDAALAGLEIGGLFPAGAGAEAASKAAPIFSRPLGQVVKEAGAKLLTKEGALAAGKAIGKEAAAGAGYNTLGAISQGATKPGELAKSAAVGAATAPLLAGAMKLGARGVSELAAGEVKTPFKKYQAEVAKAEIPPEKTAIFKPKETPEPTPIQETETVIPTESNKAAKSVVKPEEPLIAEARKYKSAEEFVKTQGKPIYHGTNADFKVFDKKKIGSATDEGLFGSGFYFGNTESFARIAPGGRGAKNIMEVYPSSDVKLFDIAKVKSKQEMADLLDMSELALTQDSNGIVRPVRDQSGQFTSHLKSLGYDGVVVRRGGDSVETVIFEPDKIKTKAQLTDIWNKAHSVVQETTGISKVAQSVNAKSIEKNLTGGFKDLAGYEKMNLKDQAQRASEVLKNIDDTLAMLRGEKQVPNGLNEAMFLKAAEDHAYATKNIDLLQEIAKSPLTSETSHSAQTLRALAERDPDSATAKIMELKKAREDAMLKKTKQRDANAVVSEAKKEIQKRLKEAQPTRETWSSFIDSIKCK